MQLASELLLRRSTAELTDSHKPKVRCDSKPRSQTHWTIRLRLHLGIDESNCVLVAIESGKRHSVPSITRVLE
jgi:hypothetical protein